MYILTKSLQLGFCEGNPSGLKALFLQDFIFLPKKVLTPSDFDGVGLIDEVSILKGLNVQDLFITQQCCQSVGIPL